MLSKIMLAVLILSCVACASPGSIIYVDVNAPGLNLGTSWPLAYNCLQDALAVAQPGDTIKVARGTYRPTESVFNPQTGRDVTFNLLTGVTIMGGYAGYGSPDPDKRDIQLYETILSGDLNSDDLPLPDINDVNDWVVVKNLPTMFDRQDNSITVVTADHTEPNAVLDGFTITGGMGIDDPNDPWPYFGQRGAGLDLKFASATILNCTFRLNSSPGGAGAIFAYNCDPNIIDCNFVGNYSDDDAGALTLWGSDALIQNCEFNFNVVASDQTGGAVYLQSSDPNFEDCLFEGNNGGRQSGAVHNNYSSPEFLGCRFIDNKASRQGGAIRNSTNSWPYFENCEFMHNTCSIGDGGAVDNYYAYPTFVSCIFTDNNARHKGGASSNRSSECMFINCLFNRNVVTDDTGNGGAMSNIDTLLTIINSTFYYNVAPQGAGIACVKLNPTLTYPSNVNVANTILWDGGDEFYNENSSVVDVNYSDVQGGWVGTGNIYAYPNFTDNDGPDNLPGNEDDDLTLKPASPCIDAGNNLAVPLEILYDLAGESRKMDDLNTVDTGNGVAPIVDIGAYEFAGVGGLDHAPVADAGPDQTVQITSGNTALVTLDGSGSYDVDGDPLFYAWSWTVNNVNYSATGVSPTITLPAGQYTIQLIVHDGTYISNISTVTITVVEQLQVQVSYLPVTISRSDTNSYFFATVRLNGITPSQLNTNVPLQIVPAGILSLYTFVQSDSSGTTINALFNRQAILNAIPINGTVSLTTMGQLMSGDHYSATNSIQITN